jgi:hypothetical protein
MAGGRPELKAINGGLIGNVHHISEEEAPDRGHLRLVKSDVG